MPLIYLLSVYTMLQSYVFDDSENVSKVSYELVMLKVCNLQFRFTFFEDGYLT